MSWNDGYVTEIDYTRGYYRELSPAHLGFALLTKGLRAPAGDIKYLELGFGQGISLNIHAAACRGEFWGTDFNPAQAAGAQELATASGNGARLFDHSFAELAARDDLPEFDVIGLHGIYSWISPENRASIVEIIRRQLKPGGIVYVSYNCLPGWAPAAPMSHLFRLHASLAGNQASPVTKRVEDAFEFAQKLEGVGALYFRANPVLKSRLEQLGRLDKSYLAHEYLNEHWHPMHFDQMAGELEPAKLTFGTSASLLEHVDALNLTEPSRAVLAGLSNWVLRESVRDYLMNQQFRRDIWVRGARQMATDERNVALRSLRFVLTRYVSSSDVPEARGALGAAKLDEKTYRPIIDVLAGAAKPIAFAEIEGKLSAKGISSSQLLQSLVILTGSGYAANAQDEATVQAVTKRCTALNKQLCRQSTGGAVYLASPVLGAGVAASSMPALFIASCLAGRTKPEEWAGDLSRGLAARGQHLVKDGKALTTAEEIQREALARAKEFGQVSHPLYRRLGIV